MRRRTSPLLLSQVSQTQPTHFPLPEHKHRTITLLFDIDTYLASNFFPHQERVFTGAATNRVDSSSSLALSLVIF